MIQLIQQFQTCGGESVGLAGFVGRIGERKRDISFRFGGTEVVVNEVPATGLAKTQFGDDLLARQSLFADDKYQFLPTGIYSFSRRELSVLRSNSVVLISAIILIIY